MTLLSTIIGALVLQSTDICTEPMPGGVGEPAFCAVSEQATIETPHFLFTANAGSLVGIDTEGGRAVVQPTVFKNPIQLYIEAHPMNEKPELMKRFGPCAERFGERDSVLECDQSTDGIVRVARLYLGAGRLIYAELNAGAIAKSELPSYRMMLDSIVIR